MAITQTAPYQPSARTTSPRRPQPKRWTVDEYLAMSEAGILRLGVRTELIDGKIYEMAGMKTPHLKYSSRAIYVLCTALGVGINYVINQQLPVRLSDDTEPEPDISVFRGSQDDFEALETKATPENLALLIEISDSTYAFDSGEKLECYARNGIQEYWIVNINNNTVEQHTLPRVQVGKKGEEGVYDVTHTHRRGDVIESKAVGRFPVEDFLGKEA